jgi:magnesium-transporting ATPase (P-type)
MLNTLMPLELECALQIAKLVYSGFLMADAWMIHPDFEMNDIKYCKVRNMNMIEEMAEIEYVFCDKTGTLTKNELLFRCLSIQPHSKDTKEDDLPGSDTVIGMGTPAEFAE